MNLSSLIGICKNIHDGQSHFDGRKINIKIDTRTITTQSIAGHLSCPDEHGYARTPIVKRDPFADINTFSGRTTVENVLLSLCRTDPGLFNAIVNTNRISNLVKAANIIHTLSEVRR